MIQSRDTAMFNLVLVIEHTAVLRSETTVYQLFTYLLLTEFEVRTVSHGPSFSPFDLWPKREARGL